MNMKIAAVIFTVTAVFFNLAANDELSFCDYIERDGSGIEKMKKNQDRLNSKKKVYTTHDAVDDSVESLSLIKTLLNNEVIEKSRKLPEKQAMALLKKHWQWWQHYRNAPSLPNVNGTARAVSSMSTDYDRIYYRWCALKLSYEQYFLYEKIVESCQVRMDCGNFKMLFGEVYVKRETDWSYDEQAVKTFGKYYYDFVANILPETCCKTAENYLAVLKTESKFYLCTWDQHGKPIAVYPLADARKIVSLSVKKGNLAEVVLENSSKKTQTSVFSI